MAPFRSSNYVEGSVNFLNEPSLNNFYNGSVRTPGCIAAVTQKADI